MATKSNIPTKYYEISDKSKSGFIMDGTEGTQYQQELNAPSVQWIDSRGKTAVKGEDGTVHYAEIRYISGCDSIIPEEQDKRGFKPNRFEDKIPMQSGFMTVKRDGNTIGLYDYLERVFYNLDSNDRPSTASGRFREVKVAEKAKNLLDFDEKVTQAKMIVYELRESTGNKEKPYRYNTDRIDAICRLVGVWDEEPETKLVKLLQVATTDSENFLNIVERAEQTITIEVSHALELKVVSFDGDNVKMVDTNRVLFNFGGEKIKSEDLKIERFTSFLGTEQGTPALTEMRAKLEIAKEKSLNS